MSRAPTPDEAKRAAAAAGEVPDTSREPVSEDTATLTSDNDTSDGSDSGVKYELRDGAWLDGQKFDPLLYTVPGLMPAGLGIIAAPPKAGKSLLILDWLLAVALGGAALGALRTGPARDVLYLALEDGDRRLQSRCRHLLAPGEPIPGRFRYILAVPPGQVLAVIADALTRHPGTALIVLDTLGRIMPLPYQGETTYQRDYRVAVALKRIADDHPGLTIVVIHHTRKAFSDDFIDSISGTHGLAGAADTIIALSRGRGDGDGILHVTGRDVIEAGVRGHLPRRRLGSRRGHARRGPRQRQPPGRHRRAVRPVRRDHRVRPRLWARRRQDRASHRQVRQGRGAVPEAARRVRAPGKAQAWPLRGVRTVRSVRRPGQGWRGN